jgi:predicted DNA-binding transcriptional regulator AlpA
MIAICHHRARPVRAGLTPESRSPIHRTRGNAAMDRIAAAGARDTPRPPSIADDTYSLVDIYSATGRSTQTVRRWSRAGWMPAPIKIGRELRFVRGAIDRLLEDGCKRRTD